MPNGENCTLEELHVAAQCSPSKKSQVRFTAIRALLMGISHEQVLDLFVLKGPTLRSWIRRFNDRGIDGLIDKKSPGAPRKITPEQTEKYRELIVHPEQAGQAHWTGRKFHGWLSEQFDHEIGYRTVVRWLHEQDFRLKVPQPWPDRQDEERRQAFLQTLGVLLRDPDVDLWYLDEVGVEGDPRPRRRWAERGTKPRVTRNGNHVRMSATGMVCPRTGEFYALEFSHSDSVIFQTFLSEANRDVRRLRQRNILICDNASWHKKKSLDWGAFEPVFLPPYSPDFNPIERLWRIMKGEWFTDHIAKNHEQLIERLDQALNWLIQRKEKNKKTCRIEK